MVAVSELTLQSIEAGRIVQIRHRLANVRTVDADDRRLRLLVISCSSAKRRRPKDKIPAIQRYDGIFYKVLRKTIREGTVDYPLIVAIISAKYGLITPDTLIPAYNMKMNACQAKTLGPVIRKELQKLINKHKPGAILINLGKAYAAIIRNLPELNNAVRAAGPIGKRAAILKSWLTDDNPS